MLSACCLSIAATLKVLTSAQIRVLLVEPNGLEPIVADLVARKRDQHRAAEAAFARVFGMEAEAERAKLAAKRHGQGL